MKRVCVSTLCDLTSFGSVLQAYALKQALRELGAESFILREKPLSAELRPHRGRSPQTLLLNLHQRFIRSKLEAGLQGTKAFTDESLDFYIYHSDEKLREQCPPAELYLAGSDQVWNPKKLLPVHFMEFAPDPARKVSYAASMGLPKLTDAQAEWILPRLARFDAISVRELDGAEALGTRMGRAVSRNVDPVFLNKTEDWVRLAERKPYPLSGPYILVYPIYWDHALNARLKALHKKTGLPIILLSSQLREIYATKTIYDADLLQFLWLVRHAAAVVSSSFHGVSMSILFHRPFSAVINPADASRLTSLLSVLGLNNLDLSELSDGKQDFSEADKRIAAERDSGLSYLKEVLRFE